MDKHRICIIGNSHVAALRAGLDLVPEITDQFDFDSFAAHSDLMRNLELRGTVLVPTSPLTRQRMSQLSKGREEIDVSAYTGFILVGLRFNMVRVFDVLKNHRIFGLINDNEAELPYISMACFASLIESILENSTAMHLARLLRQASNARIVIVPQPLPSGRILKREGEEIWRQAVSSGLLGDAVKLFEAAAWKVAKNAGCEFLSQPSGTLSLDLFTHEKFAHNSIALSPGMDKKFSPYDPYHMNGLYGAEILRAFGSIPPNVAFREIQSREISCRKFSTDSSQNMTNESVSIKKLPLCIPATSQKGGGILKLLSHVWARCRALLS